MFNHNIWNHSVQVLPHLTQELPDWKQFEITEVPQFIVRTGSISRNGPKPNPSKSDKLSRIPETVSEFPCYLLQSGVYKWKGRWDQKCTVLLHTVSQSVDVISSHLWSGPWCIGMTTVCTHTHPSHLNIRWHGHFLTPFSQLWFHFLSLYSLCKGVDLEFSDLWKHFLSFHRRSKRPCSINQEISCTRLAFRNSSLIIKWAIPLHDPRSEQVHSSMMRWMCCKIRLSCRLLTSRWQQAGAFLEAKRHINA